MYYQNINNKYSAWQMCGFLWKPLNRNKFYVNLCIVKNIITALKITKMTLPCFPKNNVQKWNKL